VPADGVGDISADSSPGNVTTPAAAPAPMGACGQQSTVTYHRRDPYLSNSRPFHPWPAEQQFVRPNYLANRPPHARAQPSSGAPGFSHESERGSNRVIPRS
jgi:hypothetical protein